MANYEKGDHLWVKLYAADVVPFAHHGLYVGNGMVIEKCQTGVKKSTLHEFSEGNEIHVEEHLFRPFTREQSCERAYSQLDDESYFIVHNNCETFVNWCINGIELSGQVAAVAGIAAMAHPVTRVAGAVVSGSVVGNFISTKLPKGVIKAISENPVMQNDVTQTTAENPITSVTAGVGAGIATLVALPVATGAVVGFSAIGAAVIGGGYAASKLKKWIKDEFF